MEKHILSSLDLERQEHLSTEILHRFDISIKTSKLEPRPKENFIDLMNWTESSFRGALKDIEGLNRLVHNRIIIDGQFLQFCKENKILVECLYKDSVVSWKTEHDFEKFFVQGVFLIKSKGVEFIHAALFHKGNQYEDEISFFVIVSKENYQGYIDLRNQFDLWSKERDRSNYHIRVIDGEDLPYTNDYTWEDLFLPTGLKNEIRSSVESFLSSKDFYVKSRIPWKTGILLWGDPGCGKTSLIRTIMSVYNFKPVTITPNANDEVIRDAFAYAEEQSPSLLYFEDLDSLLERNIALSSFLNLMDGVSSKNGLLVMATANDIRGLKNSIVDRPSRFDRKFEIPLPDKEMAHAYLVKWFGKVLSVKKAKELANYSERYGFSYAHLKELYISSMFEALSKNRKTPTEKDIERSLLRLIKDKSILNGDVISTDKYFGKG